MDARPPILRARLFPLKTVTDKQVEVALQSLRTAAMLDLYVVDGRAFLQLRTWENHQTIRAKRSKFPSPDCNMKTSEIICKQMQADVHVIQSESNPNPIRNPNPNPIQSNSALPRFVCPSLDELSTYCTERKNKVDPQAFIDFYESKGWKVGNQPMKSWQAAVRTWERNRNGSQQQQSGNIFLEMLEERGGQNEL
jgi:hypothetical protein